MNVYRNKTYIYLYKELKDKAKENFSNTVLKNQNTGHNPSSTVSAMQPLVD